MTDGDEVVIMHQTDLIQIQQILTQDNDHVQMDGMFQVDENGMQ
jgi:hypothetical protein